MDLFSEILATEDLEQYKTFDKNLDPKIRDYLKWEKNECNSALVKELALKRDLKTLKRLLDKRRELTSEGIRGDMIPGFSGINDVVVIQTGQGLVKYLEEADCEKLKESGVVIGYDARYNSKRYSELLATIFVNQNYPVRLFTKEVTTPLVPFAVRKYNSVAGIMVGGGVCAKDFNELKIFGSNGCQVTHPVDASIEEFILQNLEPMEQSWNVEILEVSQMLSDPYSEVMEDYLKLVSDSIFSEYKAIAAKSTIKFAYTPLHGIAYEVFKKVVDNHCLMVQPVPGQESPNPDFPTVKNLEIYQPKALVKAKLFADKNKIDYILATDPVGCKMIFIQKDTDTKEWVTYTGNELATLFGWWSLDQYKQTAPKPFNLKNVYMIGSTVSSKILQSMARQEKFNFVETLPGFKWIGNQAYDLENQGKKTVFSFEDNYGFMFSDDLLYKDGIQACVQMMTMVCYFDAKEIKLREKLDELYTLYGFHLYIGSYFNADNYEVIEQIFEKLRKFEETVKPTTKCTCVPEAYKDPSQEGCCCNPQPPTANIKKYPKSIGNGKYNIFHIRDITLGFDNNEPSRKSVLPAQPDVQMITFEFVNGLVATLRTNPKETKLRYSVELVVKPESMTKTEGTRLLNEMVHKIIHEFINPGKNGLSLPLD